MPNGKDQGGSAVAENKPAKKAKSARKQKQRTTETENANNLVLPHVEYW